MIRLVHFLNQLHIHGQIFNVDDCLIRHLPQCQTLLVFSKYLNGCDFLFAKILKSLRLEICHDLDLFLYRCELTRGPKLIIFLFTDQKALPSFDCALLLKLLMHLTVVLGAFFFLLYFLLLIGHLILKSLDFFLFLRAFLACQGRSTGVIVSASSFVYSC